LVELAPEGETVGLLRAPGKASGVSLSRVSLGVLAGLLLVTPVCAQQMAASTADLDALSIEQLAEVEITSVSRRPELLAKAPAAVYMISGEDIRRSGAVNLPEALRLAPNLEVARINGFSYTISARGFNSPESSNKLLVLVDGRSVYSPLASSVFWENVDVPLADVARIEVVSGPGGALYGANAVNGVINVVTKASGETQGLAVDATAGTTDNKFMARYGFTPWAGTTLRLYGQVSRANNTVSLSALAPYRDAWARNQGGFRLDHEYGRDTFTLQGDIYANSTPAMEIEKGRGFNVTGRWTRAFQSGDTLELQIYRDEANRILPGLAQEQLYASAIQIQHNTSLGWNDVFTWGAEVRSSKESFYSQNVFTFADPTSYVNVQNLFAQNSFKLLDDLRLTAGLKVENSSFSNLDFLPDLRLAWDVADKHLLWTSISRAVRTPSKIDRELMAPGILLPAPRFRPEKLTAFEVGYRGEPMDRLSLSASFYYNQYDDIRTTFADPVTIIPVQLRNGITGDAYGVEAWGKYGMTDWWRLNFGFSWVQRLQGLKPGRNDFSNGQALGQDPSHQVQLRSEMNPFEDWEFDAGLRVIGHVKMRNPATGATRVVLGSYMEGDARIGWRGGRHGDAAGRDRAGGTALCPLWRSDPAGDHGRAGHRGAELFAECVAAPRPAAIGRQFPPAGRDGGAAKDRGSLAPEPQDGSGGPAFRRHRP
jgi:iron complex outermembrane receptor protein